MGIFKSPEEKITSAIEEFNKQRSPEATAVMRSFDKRLFKVMFTGSFCRTCGYHDYFDDLLSILEDKKFKAKVYHVDELADGAIVEFQVLK